MLHSIAAALAAAAFVGSLFMWVRSYWADNQLHYARVSSVQANSTNELRGTHLRLSSSRGRVTLALMKSRTPDGPHSKSTTASTIGPALARWDWTDWPDDLNEVRKTAKKWEKRYVFEYGRVVHRDPKQGGVNGASQQSAYLVVWWPEVVLVLGLIAWPLTRRELARRSRPWRLLHGYCVECGYDLRKSLGACPECGKGRWGLE